MPEFDRQSEPVRVMGLRKQSEYRLVCLVSYDELTGQYNRTRLREALQSALAYSGRYDVIGWVCNDRLGVVLFGSSSANVASIAEKILNGVQQSAWEGG